MSTSKEISEKILDYLLRNPEAGDTLEGVSRWWLEMENVDRTVDIVGSALDKLLKQGLIEKLPSGTSAPVYRIKRTGKNRVKVKN